MAQLTTAKRERLIKRKERYEGILDSLYSAMERAASSDVQSYGIGSRNLTYKSPSEIQAAIDKYETKLEAIDAELGGHRRKAVAVIIRDA